MRIFLLACLLVACARAEAKPPPGDRSFTIHGHPVTIPGAWVGCREDKDCVWVIAGCDNPETGVNVSFGKPAQQRFNKACADSDLSLLRVLHKEPPPCREEVCAGSAFDNDLPLPSFAPPSPSPTPKKKKAPPGDRRFTIQGHEVTIPGSWLGCKEDKDCAWIYARCEDVFTAVSVTHAAAARSRFDKACAGSSTGTLGVGPSMRPPCGENVCLGGPAGPGAGVGTPPGPNK